MKLSIESNNFAIDLALFNQIPLYHLVNPCSRKLFNLNVYQLILILITIIIECIIIYGLTGHFIDMEDTTDEISALLLIFANIVNLMTLLKITNLVCKANNIWELLNTLRVNFLTSKHCRKNINILFNYHEKSTKIIYFVSSFLVLGYFIWAGFPLLFYATSFQDVDSAFPTSQRMDNILNYRFPVNVYTYNKYFILFYIIELGILTLMVFMHAVFEIFIISFSYIIVAQYEIIALAFENVGCEESMTQNENGE